MISPIFINDLEHLRKQLGMSCAVVAERAQLGLRTVQRVLSGSERSPELATVSAIASALGASLKLDRPNVARMKQQRARQKADRLLALTQGTSALEAQAIPQSALSTLRQETIATLLAGSPRRLWSDE